MLQKIPMVRMMKSCASVCPEKTQPDKRLGFLNITIPMPSKRIVRKKFDCG